MSAWKDVIDAHRDFLTDAGGNYDDADNATRESDSQRFTFERNEQPHEILQDDEGGAAYSQAGTMLKGSVDPDVVQLGAGDVVTIGGVRWRVAAVSDVRMGSELVSQDVALVALEG